MGQNQDSTPDLPDSEPILFSQWILKIWLNVLINHWMLSWTVFSDKAVWHEATFYTKHRVCERKMNLLVMFLIKECLPLVFWKQKVVCNITVFQKDFAL
jgi:hypothetical protein